MDSNLRKAIDFHYEYIAWKINKNNPSGHVKTKAIKTLTLNEDKAHLYDDEVLQHGVLEVENEDGEATIFLFVIAEI